jgi:hypothetical protein
VMMLLLPTLCLGQEYYGQKDRYDVAKLQNDPETLVSLAKHESRTYEAKKEDTVVVLPKNDNDEVTVTTTWEEEKE